MNSHLSLTARLPAIIIDHASFPLFLGFEGPSVILVSLLMVALLIQIKIRVR